MCISDPDYREFIEQKKRDDFCEDFKTFFKQLSLRDRPEVGMQLIQFMVLETPFGIENITKLTELFNELKRRLGL